MGIIQGFKLSEEDMAFVNTANLKTPYLLLMDQIRWLVANQDRYDRWDWDELESVYQKILYHIRIRRTDPKQRIIADFEIALRKYRHNIFRRIIRFFRRRQ